jgi:toxin FitB
MKNTAMARIESQRYIIDSPGWLEYLSSGPKAVDFATYIEIPENVLLPTIVLYEVYRVLVHEQCHELAEGFLSQMFMSSERLVNIDVDLAQRAALLSIEKQMCMATAMVYAAALKHRATLVTSDSRLESLDSVTLI